MAAAGNAVMGRARDMNPVRQRREELRMLLVELAAKVDGSLVDGVPVRCSPPLLSHIEANFYPRARTQQAIADALGSTREVLFPLEFE